MSSTATERLRDDMARGRWQAIADQLKSLSSHAAADLVMSLPFDQQQALFRKLPVEFSSALIGSFPYFHAYVLLHSRPVDEMRAIVDGMTQGQRDHFFDELPEEAWAHLMRELETGAPLEPRGETAVEEIAGA